MNENSTIENELMVLPESVAKLARDLGGQLEIANGDFEESLLDQVGHARFVTGKWGGRTRIFC